MAGMPWRTGGVLGGLALWLVAALALGASGRVAALRPPAPQLVLLGLTVALAAAVGLVPGLRAWALAVDLRALVALHLTRVVGAYFLALAARGALPRAFAVPAGWGDLVVAAGALLLLLAGPPASPGRRRTWGVWNLLGLADIVFVVATASRLALAEPGSMAALQRLPLSLLPTFLVPLIIVSHLVLGARLWRVR